MGLSQNCICETGVEELADGLYASRTLTSLSLADSTFGELGVECFVVALRASTTLKHSSLGHNVGLHRIAFDRLALIWVAVDSIGFSWIELDTRRIILDSVGLFEFD